MALIATKPTPSHHPIQLHLLHMLHFSNARLNVFLLLPFHRIIDPWSSSLKIMGILKDTDVIYAIFIDLKSGCLQFNLTSSQWSHILVHCYDFILHAVAHIASLPWKISLVLYSSTGWQLTMSHGCCKVHRCLLKVCKNQYRHNYVMGQNHPGFLFRNLQTCVLRIFSHKTSAFPIGCTSEHMLWCMILDHVIT